jgi:hypothetical protein
METQPLPDWKYIKGMILYGTILAQGRIGVNSKYPKYYLLVKEAVR